MPRRPRIEYPGAIYHVINRGNYRADVFSHPKTAAAFLTVLGEAAKRYGWELGAFVVMRNHFHLALRTPEPNLSRGMQWLQTTFAVRFNRFRGVHGHLFQGRYKAFVLQNEGVWARVADYIHLNPVRAGIVPVEDIKQFRWSSLHWLTRGRTFAGLSAHAWLETLGIRDSPSGWRAYEGHLISLASRGGPEWDVSLSSGWAIGDTAWMQELSEQLQEKQSGSAAKAFPLPQEMREKVWLSRLEEIIAEVARHKTGSGRTLTSRQRKAMVGARLQAETGAPVAWIAAQLELGRTASARVALSRARRSYM